MREAYLYLLDHQADGRCLLLFPNSASSDNRMPAGQEVNLADSGDRFHIRIQPPLGIDVLQVIARLEPLAELDAPISSQGTPVVSAEILAKVRDELLKDRTNWTEARLPITTTAKSAPPAKREPARFALLLGVDRSQDERVSPPQEYFRSSAEHLAQVLAKRGGFAQERIRVLTGDQASA